MTPYYDDGDVTLYRGSCELILPRLPAGTVDLVLTSPPYNIGKPYEVKAPLADYVADQTRVIALCGEVLADHGSLCWQVGNWTQDGEVIPIDCLLYPIFKDAGFMLRNRIVWTFGHGLHCTKRFSGRHETVLWFTKASAYTFNLDPVRIPSKYPGKRHYKGPRKGELSGNPLGKNPGDVWDIPNVKHNHPEKSDHPCQFPEELASRLIAALTDPGAVVLDPYVGSGTTLRAAKDLGRAAIGIEREEAYCRTAVRRLAQSVMPLEIPA